MLQTDIIHLDVMFHGKYKCFNFPEKKSTLHTYVGCECPEFVNSVAGEAFQVRCFVDSDIFHVYLLTTGFVVRRDLTANHSSPPDLSYVLKGKWVSTNLEREKRDTAFGHGRS